MTEAVTTLSGLFLNTCRAYPKPNLLMYKDEGSYRSISTAEFESRVRRLSLGLRKSGLRPGDKVVILSENRPEWVITDFAVLCAGGITVPIYTSLMPEQIGHIIRDSDAKFVVCSNRDLWLKVEAVRRESSARPTLRAHRGRRAARAADPPGNRRGGGPDRSGRPRRIRAGGPRRPPRRPRLHHLHVRHDRDAPRGHVEPRQPDKQRRLAGLRRPVSVSRTRRSPSCPCPTSWSGRRPFSASTRA